MKGAETNKPKSTTLESLSLEDQLKFGREVVKPLKLSVKSSLNYFRLRVTTTGVDEVEH